MQSISRLRLAGPGRARGQAHGEALRSLVQEHLERWEQALHDDIGMARDDYLDKLYAETAFFPAIEQHTPDLLEEVRGIAEGANVDFRVILARQLSDEEPWFRRGIKIDAMRGAACSSLGVNANADGTTLIGQNMDCPQWYDGHQVLLDLHDPATGLDTLVFTVAGKISLAGMNSAGLGICCNTLAQLDHALDGLPEDFVVRGFLSHRTLEEGLSFMHRITHASGQNYTVAGPGSQALNLEVSGKRVMPWRPHPDSPVVLHTNHPFANPDRGIYEAWTTGMDEAQIRQLFSGTSAIRFEALAGFVNDHHAAWDLAAMKKALSVHPVCRHGEIEGRTDGYTIGCLLMELGASPRFHVAPGPPCETPFVVHNFA